MIRNLKNNDGQWYWDYVNEYDERRECRTDSAGDGIWEYAKTGGRWMPENKPVYEWKQIVGSCQFSLSGYSISGARKKLNRYYKEEEK